MTNETTKTIETSITGGLLTLTFSNGDYLILDPTQMVDNICHAAMMHGFKQKLVDAAAISRNPDTGRSATVEDKMSAVLDVATRLLSGQWNKVRDGAGATVGGLLFRALCIAYPAKTPEQLRDFLGKRSAEEKTALRKKFADIIETLKAPSDDGADVDGMLDELND